MQTLTSTAEDHRQSAVAYQRIKDAIISGEMGPGYQSLEPELALRLGMSRTPVREALVRLERDGFVELIPRRGMRVASLSPNDIYEITEVLACLEVEAAARLAANGASTEILARFDQAIAAMDRALAQSDLAGWNEADYAFHLLLVQSCGNRHLVDTAQRFLEKADRFRVLTSAHRMPPTYSNVNHAAVVEAIRQRDPQSAAEIHRSHKRRWMRELEQILKRFTAPPESRP
ncbi:MAG: GntR family transcriptional regulator [Lysobacterales bacterium]